MGIVVPVGAVPQGTFGTGRANGLLLNTQRRGHKPTALLFKKKKRFIGGLMLWQSGLSLHLQQSPSCSTFHALPAASH